MRREGVRCAVMYVTCERQQELGELPAYYNRDYGSSWHFKHWNQCSQCVFQSAQFYKKLSDYLLVIYEQVSLANKRDL